jgi:hypothetical protein
VAVWTVAVEGDSDLPVVLAILAACGQECGIRYVVGGRDRVDKSLKGWCAAAARSPWLILRDLDRDTCAPALLTRIAPPNARAVRIAVRTVEAWLLADRERAASWLGVPVGKIPRDVESLLDPKAELINLARTSRIQRIREDIVPRTHAHQGPGYVEQLRRYCADRWRPDEAARRAPSLERCLRFVAGRR